MGAIQTNTANRKGHFASFLQFLDINEQNQDNVRAKKNCKITKVQNKMKHRPLRTTLQLPEVNTTVIVLKF